MLDHTCNVLHASCCVVALQVALHPGWVQTDMGMKSAEYMNAALSGSGQAGAGAIRPPLTPDQSVGGMLRVIAALTPQDTGRFLSYDGTVLTW